MKLDAQFAWAESNLLEGPQIVPMLFVIIVFQNGNPNQKSVQYVEKNLII